MMALTNSKLNGSGNIFVNLNDVEDEDQKSPLERNWKGRLDEFLNRIWVQTTIVITVFLQLLIITFLLLMEFKVIQPPPPSERQTNGNHSQLTTSTEMSKTELDNTVEKAEDALNIINIVIFILFLFEVILRIVARNSSIIQDKLQILDGIMVVVVTGAYVSLLVAGIDRSAVYIIAYLIVFRLWRIGRIYHDITENERRKAERVINRHRKEAKDTEQYALSMKAKIEEQKNEIASLREQLRIYCPNMKPSPATRSISQHTHTPDDPVTSEDEYDRNDDHTKSVLELVKAELSGNQDTGATGHRPGGSVTSATPNGSVPNMTPSSSCSHLVGESDPDRISNKFPDLVEQAQGLEVKETNEQGVPTLYQAAHGSSDEPSRTKSGYVKNKPVRDNLAHVKSLTLPMSQSDKPKLDEKFAYNNPGFEPDKEVSIKRSKAEGQDELSEIKRISEVPFVEQLGSSTYLNNEGIPMTDL